MRSTLEAAVERLEGSQAAAAFLGTYADETTFWVGPPVGRLRMQAWMEFLYRFDLLEFRDRTSTGL